MKEKQTQKQPSTDPKSGPKTAKSGSGRKRKKHGGGQPGNQAGRAERLRDDDPVIIRRLELIKELWASGHSKSAITLALMRGRKAEGPLEELPPLQHSQAYVYFEAAEKQLREQAGGTAEHKFRQAYNALVGLKRMAVAAGQLRVAKELQDRINLMDGVANPITSGRNKVIVSAGNPEKDDEDSLGDGEIADAIREGKRAAAELKTRKA